MNSDTLEQTVLDHLPDGLVLVRDGRIAYSNHRASEILGISKRRLTGAQVSDLLPGAAEVVSRVVGGAMTCTARDLSWSRPGAARRVTFVGSRGPATGEVLLVVRVAGLPTDPGAREAFRRRLEWLDGLAAGMAHEIRNPLGGIRGAAQLLRRDPDPAEVDELTGLIIRETDRINSIVEQLMLFTRPRPLRRDRVQLNRLVHDEVALLVAQQRAPSSDSAEPVEFVLDLDPSLPEVEGDARRLREAVGNLLRNGWQAARARVTVRTRVEPEARLREQGRDRGLALRLSVQDDGPGIDPARLPGLFAPFATTRNEGSGLGLFVTRLSIDEHAGMLSADPGPGTGATFEIQLWERLPAEPETTTGAPDRVPLMEIDR